MLCLEMGPNRKPVVYCKCVRLIRDLDWKKLTQHNSISPVSLNRIIFCLRHTGIPDILEKVSNYAILTGALFH